MPAGKGQASKETKRGHHWAARPLPPPPINHRKATGPGEPSDRRDPQTEEWLKDFKIASTEDGD